MEPEDEDQAPSKSARKRAATAAQELGVALIGLSDAQLEALALPDRLVDAVRAARGMSSRGALSRQHQYIGKLMRAVELEPIRAALAARSEESYRSAARFKRVEAWRERLVAEGIAALPELERLSPGLDRAHWEPQVRAAQAERQRLNANGPAGRELFRALDELFATMP